MRNSKRILNFIFVLFLVSNACNITSSEDEIDYVPGEVIISLEEGAQETDVKQRIEELQLEWKKYYENLGFALISVPVGEEKLWAEKLAEEPMIRSAELNHKFNLLGSR
jgi:hypothetical protein